MKAQRTCWPAAAGFAADANIQPRHPADAATWVWHPQIRPDETAFLRFSLEFTLEESRTLTLHVSADQRFQLSCDGSEIGFGPDRCTVANWSVASYDLTLTRGLHRLTALVWWLADGSLSGQGPLPPVRPPIAQATWRGGFLLAGEDGLAAQLNTGRAAWWVEEITPAVTPVAKAFFAYHDIGPEFLIDGARRNSPARPVRAIAIVRPIPGNPHGVQRPGWQLGPVTLAEQARLPVRSGRLRALSSVWTDGSFEEMQASADGEGARWGAWLSGNGELTIPPGSARTVLWDFEDYVCGYAKLVTFGGPGARIRIDWAESLHEAPVAAAVNGQTAKGRRDQITGKVFCGFGDEFVPAGGTVHFPAFWWRSGRYLCVRVRTAEAALTLKSLTVIATGYPLGQAATFTTDDPELNRLLAVCERTLRACAHEVWTDCPYYEQMAYVGDSRLAALNNYALFADDRLSRRMLELFDESRRGHGLVAERTPSAWPQVSVTYALLWVLMVRDFAWWRDDPAFVRARLRGVRAMMEEVLALAGPDGLLHQLPGWSFVDWVPGWAEGCGPGVRAGDSSIVNLHLLLALRAHAEVEAHCGEPELAALATRRADRLAETILGRYWCASRGLLADTGAFTEFSEHAQALGLLAGIKPPGGVPAWTKAWLAAEGLAQATVYFSFYVMEALHFAGQGDELHRRIDVVRGVPATGLLTMPEAPEPTRSDCHGWSAHWRWQAVASVAGVRPVAPGFAQVEIVPQFGKLRTIDAEVRHPRGVLRISLQRDGEQLSGRIELPPGIPGELRWLGVSRPLETGGNIIAFDALTYHFSPPSP